MHIAYSMGNIRISFIRVNGTRENGAANKWCIHIYPTTAILIYAEYVKIAGLL